MARNSGARAAKGRLLLFLDADTRPSPGLLETYRKVFKEDDVVAATGPVLPLEKARATVAAGYFFVSMVFVKASILLSRPCIVGSNFAVRKDSFMKAKGFNSKMITYDIRPLSGICFQKDRVSISLYSCPYPRKYACGSNASKIVYRGRQSGSCQVW